MSEGASPSVITFGCRLNSSESQIIEGHLKTLGVHHNTIVINSCTVTQNADKESFAKVAQLVRQNSTLEFPKKIFVTGCSSQLHAEKYRNLGVDRIIENDNKLLIDAYKSDFNPFDALKEDKYDPPKISRIESKTRAFVQIQNGCDHDCTFCVIYKARGKNRSVPISSLIEQIRSLVKSGCSEVVLTGVDITDYGKDLTPRMSLAKLVQKILILVPSLSRLRFSSVDVAEIDDELLDIMANNSVILPYFHLSLQSGSNMILKRMKRRHSRDDIVNFCEKILNLRSDSVFGADVIAGFPTETDDLFKETTDLLTSIPRFIFLHVFPFSAHSGTPAARMPQVGGKIIKSRAKTFREIGRVNIEKFVFQKINSREKVLFESKNLGKTEQFLNIRLQNHELNNLDNDLSGKILYTKITNAIFDSKVIGREFLYLECAISE